MLCCGQLSSVGISFALSCRVKASCVPCFVALWFVMPCRVEMGRGSSRCVPCFVVFGLGFGSVVSG